MIGEVSNSSKLNTKTIPDVNTNIALSIARLIHGKLLRIERSLPSRCITPFMLIFEVNVLFLSYFQLRCCLWRREFRYRKYSLSGCSWYKFSLESINSNGCTISDVLASNSKESSVERHGDRIHWITVSRLRNR